MLERDFSALCTQRLQAIGVTKGLLYFILYIGKHPNCATGDLIKDLHMDWGHAQRSVDKLVQDGFVRKEKNQRDKRAYHLSLTPQGEHAFDVSHQLFFDWDASALQGLSREETEQLFTLLERLIQRKGDFVCVRNNQQPGESGHNHP